MFLRSVVVALSLILVQTGCDRSHSASGRDRAGNERGVVHKVKIVRVQEAKLERNVTALGSFAAYDQATLSAKIAGRLEALEVDIGSAVKAGDVIARIERREYELRVRQAEAALAAARARLGLSISGTDEKVDPEGTSTVKQARAVLDEAKANRERTVRLSENGVAARSELDTVESAYQVALNRYHDALEEVHQRQATAAQRRVELEIARQELSNTTIVAPFEGVIQDRRANAGEYVAQGTPIATLMRINPLRLRLEISERDAPRIRLGQQVRIRVEGDDKLRTGQIKRVSPGINEQNRMLLVEADVPNDGPLHPGLFARAAIAVSNEVYALVVPLSALVTFAGLEKVFVVKESRAEERLVVAGERGTNWVELVSGVVAGERVIAEPAGVQHQQPVTAVD